MNRIALLVALLAACSTPPATEDAPTEPAATEAPAPEQADTTEADAETRAIAELTLRLRGTPADAASILATAGMSAGEYEAALYAIAEDPDRSAAFIALTEGS